MGEKMILIQI